MVYVEIRENGWGASRLIEMSSGDTGQNSVIVHVRNLPAYVSVKNLPSMNTTGSLGTSILG